MPAPTDEFAAGLPRVPSPAPLRALTLHNYRSFARSTRVEFRPLTLVFGRNSAGKSALLRALPLLAASFEANRVLNPLALESEAARGASFRDLLCRAGSPQLWMELGLSFATPDGDASLAVRVQEDERSRHFVERFTMSSTKVRLSGQWRIGEALHTFDIVGEADDSKVVTQGPLHPFDRRFHELVPIKAPWGDLRRSIFDATSTFASRCHWLGSLRAVPPRKRSFPPTFPDHYGATGVELWDALAWEAREERPLATRVGDWYRKHFNVRLTVTPTEPGWETYRVRLGPVGAAHDVDLCDTGEGMAQALPVVTAVYRAAEASSDAPVTLALEQPELHLHLDAQHALADLLCEVVQQPSPPTLVIETHSESLLVALQLAVATGKLSPEAVIVHVVRALADGSSVIDTVRFDALARPNGAWPHEMFRQVIDDARQLAAARRSARST